MGDLGLPGSVVRDDRRRRAEGAVGGAQGRPQHHDEHARRRQAGVLHRGLRGAARAPGRLHRPADRGVRASTARAAPGTRTRRSARCTCGRSSTCAATARAKMRAIAEEACALVREYKGAYLRRARRRPGAQRVGRVAVRPAARRARSRRSRTLFDPDGPHESRQDRARRRDGRPHAVPLPPGYATLPLATALDWSAWNVHNDPVTDTMTRAGHRRRSGRRLRARPSRCATTTATAASSTPARCARATASRATSST